MKCLLLVGGFLLLNELVIVISILLWLSCVMLILFSVSILGEWLCSVGWFVRCWVKVCVVFDLEL